MDFPTAHAVLRDRRRWLGARAGLAIDRNGNLLLARVPAPANGKSIELATAYPYPRDVSGIAVGPCDAVFIADTAHDRVLFVDGLCNAQAWMPRVDSSVSNAPGHFRRPRGLAFTPEALLVADSQNARLQSLALPGLEAHIAWTGWAEPTSIAVDAKARVLVIDAATRRVHRLRDDRSPDVAFDASIAAQGKIQHPLHVACGADDRVIVSDAQANAVFVFASDGAFEFQLPDPAGWLPGALAVSGQTLYVADAATGAILMFEHAGTHAQLVGEVHGWRGPVTALATNSQGELFIKPALDAKYYRFAADAAYVQHGELLAGPFDAGEDREWERAWIDAETPQSTSISITAVVKGTPTTPTSGDWLPLRSSDTLLGQLTHDNRRYVWLRIELASNSSQHSPRLRQARAATAAEDLLDYLPFTYRNNDAATNGFLSRWLMLLRGEFSRIEELIDDMPRVGDPQFAPSDALPWLASWLSLELPQIASDDERRALIARAVQLAARRGTKSSIAEFVELHTGIRPAIIEAFADRTVWILGSTSRVGFDTRLPSLDPLGMIVPDEAAGAGCCPRPREDIRSGCLPCTAQTQALAADLPPMPIGHAVVGESGPLATYQIGLPLFAETAYRFCVIVDAYRARQCSTREEISRIVDREKPAHTDYRIELVAAETRVGLQARIGVDLIVGGEPPSLKLNPAQLGLNSRLPPADAARIGMVTLGGTLALT